MSRFPYIEDEKGRLRWGSIGGTYKQLKAKIGWIELFEHRIQSSQFAASYTFLLFIEVRNNYFLNASHCSGLLISLHTKL